MKTAIFRHIAPIVLLFFVIGSNASILDSIGRRIENGKIVILHKVEAKETAYSISRRYGISLETLYSANPTAKADLKVGNLLKIKTDRNADGSTDEVKPNVVIATNDKSGKFHTVEKGETLYAISKKYGISVDQLKNWNGLSSNELSNGQMLLVKKDGVEPQKPTPPKTFTKPNDGGKYHKVEKGETLYRLSKKYDVSVDDLKKMNNLTSNELELGRYIKYADKPKEVAQIKRTESVLTSTKNNRPDVTNKAADKFHIVKKGETIFSISQQYGISVDDLKSWNNLSSDDLVVRQMLAVSGSTAKQAAVSSKKTLEELNASEKTKYYPPTTYSSKSHGEEHSVEEALAQSKKTLEEHKKAQQNYNQTKKQPATNESQPKQSGESGALHYNGKLKTYEDTLLHGVKSIHKNVGKYNKTVETGVCELIEKQLWDSKYNALHHDAPIGTIIQVTYTDIDVKGEKREISVFVKVVGRLNEDANHPNRIIKISHHAVEHLAPRYNRFPVKISYLP